MVLRPRNGLSLCAGAGGLDLGLMLAEPYFHTHCWVEWEDYPRQSIIAGQRAGYFIPAPIWDDVSTFDGRPFRGSLDTILAGYPCQPFSHAGQRKGESDARHLWPEVARIIDEVRPEWALLENVAGHVSLGLETVLRDLRDMGFTSAAGLFSASEVGAPHERLRVFIVAHRDIKHGDGRGIGWPRGRCEPSDCGVNVADCNGDKWVSDPGKSFPASNGRNDPCWSGRDVVADASLGRHGGSRQGKDQQSGRAEAFGASDPLADASRSRLARGERAGSHGEWIGSSTHGSAAERGSSWLFPPGPSDMGGWAEVVAYAPHLAPSASFGDLARFCDQVAAMDQAGLVAEAEAKSTLRRMADGMAARARALRLLGNGVHPLAAANAWRTLSAAHGLRPMDLEAAREM